MRKMGKNVGNFWSGELYFTIYFSVIVDIKKKIVFLEHNKNGSNKKNHLNTTVTDQIRYIVLKHDKNRPKYISCISMLSICSL